MKGKKGKKKANKSKKKKILKKIGGAQRAAGIATSELETNVAAYSEADVERLIIEPLLTGANFLEIPARHIFGKKYLAPLAIDKAAGKSTGYYPDFSVWEKAFPILIVEAKAPEVEVDVGYREASLYARHLNQSYRSGLNPCHFIVACNGHELLAGTWDAQPQIRVAVADLLVGTAKLEELRAFCHYGILAEHALKCLAAIKPSQASKPSSYSGGQTLLSSKRPFNTFAAELSPILRRYFTSATQNNDPDIYKRAYVATDEVTSYDRILESLLKERLASRRGSLVQELEPTRTREPLLSGAIRRFETDRPEEGQLQLLVGGVGVGKSLFARRYKEMLQPQEQRERSHWAFIDFNTAPPKLEGAEDWLCKTFVSSFELENPGFDIYSAENLSRIFARDLQKRQGIYENLNAISPQEAQLTRARDLDAWQADFHKLAFGICRFFSGDKNETVVVVMDNVDRLGLENQLAAFQLALWFMSQSQAFIILQMRDETYERYKDQPPLDTFRSGITFHISPPRFIDVVKRRLELSLDYLTAHAPEKLEYVLANGARIVYPKSLVGQFLKEIYLELFERKRNIARVLQGIAGRDVRRALEMFVSILISGHLSEEAITSSVRGAKGIAIQEFTILKILMRTEYRFYNEKSGLVANIFHFGENWENPNNFLLSDVLFWLTLHRRERGELGLEGYFSVKRIADELQLRGYVRGDILAGCNELLKRQLVEADHMNYSGVGFDNAIKASSSGFIHLRILSERIEYLYGVLSVTPIFDPRVAQTLGEFLTLESRMGEISAHQKVRAVEEFLKYLKFHERRLSNAYPNFGGERTGATYVIRQVETAIHNFKHRETQPRQPNLLDV